MRFIAIGLATWRLSSLITRSDGPGQMFVVLKMKIDPTGAKLNDPGSLSTLINCLWCLSVWAGVALYFAPDWIVYGLAASSIAMAIDGLMPQEDQARSTEL